MSVQIKVKKTHPDAVMPTKGHPDDTGFDLTLVEGRQLAGNLWRYDTGISVEPPPGYYVEVVPRSSFSSTGFILANSIGVIDNSYRGNIMVTLLNVAGTYNNKFLPLPYKGFQFIVRQNISTELVETDFELSRTARGAGAFGSTNNSSPFTVVEDDNGFETPKKNSKRR